MNVYFYSPHVLFGNLTTVYLICCVSLPRFVASLLWHLCVSLGALDKRCQGCRHRTRWAHQRDEKRVWKVCERSGNVNAKRLGKGWCRMRAAFPWLRFILRCLFRPLPHRAWSPSRSIAPRSRSVAPRDWLAHIVINWYKGHHDTKNICSPQDCRQNCVPRPLAVYSSAWCAVWISIFSMPVEIAVVVKAERRKLLLIKCACKFSCKGNTCWVTVT